MPGGAIVNPRIDEKVGKVERGDRRLRAALIFAGLAVALGAGALLKAQAQKKTTPASIKQLFEEDQNDRRGAMSEGPEQWKKISERDAVRRRAAHELMDAGALKTGEDFEDASIIFQHGDGPQDYLLAHVLAMAAMEKGDAQARWIAAATMDRYLQSLKQPQIFGTQYAWAGRKPKARGATQAPYDKNLLSDALRREFCVATFADQQRNVAAMAQGKNFPSPDGCPGTSDPSPKH